jgi:hypothetical protein
VTLNQREKKIAWVVGSLLGLYVLYAFVLTPLYLEPIRILERNVATKRQQQQQEREVLANRGKVRTEWDKLIQAGLTTDPTDATTRFTESINRMIQTSRVRLVQFGGERPVTNARSDFAEVPFNLQVNCSSSNLASLLYSLESSGLPIRVDNVTISAIRPGEDNLNVELKIVILLYNPRPSSIRIAGTRPGAATRPGQAIAGGSGRGAASRPAPAPEIAPTAQPAVASVQSPGSGKTDEEIRAEMIARRRREEGGDAFAAPAPQAATQTPTPTTQPNGGAQ